jgi:UDPglucose 6-dehydrogenase
MHLFLIGAGHVGLVTAVGFARLGHRVTVTDIDDARIATLRGGATPVFEPGLQDAIVACSEAGLIDFTTTSTPPTDCRFSIVTVSTPASADGPLSIANVVSVVRGLLETTDAEHTIVIRSTLPIDGPARILAATADVPRHAALVTNPEFMREGSALDDFDHPSRLIVGWLEPRDRPAAQAVLDLYRDIDAGRLIADARSVALIKLATNVFLAAKVAYANELARICDVTGADVGVVADGIGLDPRIGRRFLDAGPGYGGSCLPEQAVALSLSTSAQAIQTPLIDAVSHSNETHQRAIVARLVTLLGREAADGRGPGDSELDGLRIGLLGLSFKANTDDVRESPALSLARYLREAGASVVATDPRAVANARSADPDLATTDSVMATVETADAVLVTTEWPQFAEIDWVDVASRMRGDLVYDTRNIVSGAAVTAAGLRYVALGRG